MIMEKYGWERCNSEVLISTPRRFGKTFSIAIFCACLALAVGLEIVVFSPARRASRKLLERIVEFIILAGGKDKIVEYNQARSKPTTGTRTLTRRSRVPLHVHTQEACRLHSFDGRKSLIRSFPCAAPNCTHTHSPDSAQTTRSRARASLVCADPKLGYCPAHTLEHSNTTHARTSRV